MRWPWSPPAILVRCPDCGSSQPNFRMLELTNHYWSGDRVLERITGYGVACQNCPCVYAVGPAGTFRRAPNSLPYTPQPGGSPLANAIAGQASIQELRERPLPPVPKERPPL